MSKPRGQKAPRRFLIAAVINSRPPACVCTGLVGYCDILGSEWGYLSMTVRVG